MRLLLAFVISLSCCLAVRARESCDKPVLGRAITRADILQLPRRDTAPPLNLQRALKIAEAFIAKQKIDIRSSYLFEAKLVTEDSEAEEKTREFWWIGLTPSTGP